MSSFRRRLVMGLKRKRLPSNYTELKYIESTGTQYIDTTFKPTRDCRIEINCRINTYNSSFFGAYNDSQQRFQVFLGTLEPNKTGSYVGYRAFTTTASQSHFDNNLIFNAGDNLKITFDVKNSKFIVNNRSMDVTDDGGPDIDYPIWLSCANQAGTVVTPSSMVIYSYKFYRNNELLQDLIPCLDNNRIPCMYDLISGKTLYNQGTGEFKFKTKTIIPDDYTLCEYLQLPYSQYFDTGIIPNQDTKLETKTAIDNLTTRFMYGARETATTTTAERALYYLSLPTDGERFAYGTNDLYLSKNIIRPLTRTIVQDKNKLYLDGVLVKTWDYTKYTAPCSIALGTTFSTSAKIPFANETTNGGCNLKIYYFRLYQNDKLVQELIPCLDNNGKPCFYDIISKQTLYSQGTGTIEFKIKETIPNNYTLCEYLESTGTQYIDTGFIPTSKTKSIVDMQCTDWTTMRANFFGSGDTEHSARFNVGMNSGKTYFQWNIANENFDNVKAKTTNRITITMDAINKSITFGYDTIIKDTPNYNLINDGTFTFWLFAGNGAFKSYCKIFGCKIYDDNELVLNMKPCLDSNGIPCMYDIVSKQSFYNQGTGELIASIL